MRIKSADDVDDECTIVSPSIATSRPMLESAEMSCTTVGAKSIFAARPIAGGARFTSVSPFAESNVKRAMSSCAEGCS